MDPLTLRAAPVACALIALAAAACGEAAPGGRSAPVSVSLVTVDQAPVARGLSGRSAYARSLSMEGSNGTLVLEEVHLLVDRLGIETADGACLRRAGPATGDDALDAVGRCQTLGTGPFVVELPLDGVPVNVTDDLLPPGRYTGLQLTVVTLEEADRAVEDGSRPSVPSRVRDAFPRWPGEAGLRVAGVFVPADGSATRRFVTYLSGGPSLALNFTASVELETTTRPVGMTVVVDPRAWFVRDDGSVPDLSTFDFRSSGQAMDPGSRLGDGFRQVRAGG